MGEWRMRARGGGVEMVDGGVKQMIAVVAKT